MARKFDKWVTPEGLAKVEAWRRDGCSVEEVARRIGVNRDTVRAWGKRFPEFAEAMRRGADDFDDEVEAALMRAAIGYDYEEEALDKEGFVHKVKKHQPANITAMIFWLKNRRPEQWREKREVRVDGALEVGQARLGELLEQLDEGVS